MDENHKLGVGTVAGGLLGAGVGDSNTATVTGAVLGNVAGTYAESRISKGNAQQVTVDMMNGGGS